MATTISGSTGVTYPAGGVDNVAGAGVGTTDTQTLTNKTLTSPTLTSPVINSATVSTVSGTAPLFMCRAGVNFDGTTSTPCTIRGSGNVTSVTKNGTGDYTVNLTTAMPDTNGVSVGSSTETIGSVTGGQRVVMTSFASTSTIRVGVTYQNGGAVDMPYVGIMVIR